MKEYKVTGPGLLIGIPTLGRPVPFDWAMAFKSMNPPINMNSTIHIIKGKPVADARNEIAKNAIAIGAKYLFFLGDDVVCPGHTIRQLLYRLENDPSVDVVGGVYCAKCDPSYPLVFRGNGQGTYWDWKIGEYFEVSGLGMDCTLIRTELFTKLSEPWFKTVDGDQFLDGINKCESWTEDLWFFEKMRKESPDSKVYCDGTVICEHWDVYGDPPRGYTLPIDSLPRRQIVVQPEKKKCLLLGYREVPENPTDEEYTYVTYGDSEEFPLDYRGAYNQMPFETKGFDRVNIHPSLWNKFGILEFEEAKRVQK